MRLEFFPTIALMVVASTLPVSARDNEPLSFNDHRQCIAALEWAYGLQDQMTPNLAAARGSVAAQTVKIGAELSSATQNSVMNLSSALANYIDNLTQACAALAPKH